MYCDKSHYQNFTPPFPIPASWQWVRLGEIGLWQSGATPSKSNPNYFGKGFPWLNTGDLNDWYINSIPKEITPLALNETSVKLNPKGSVLIAMYGATIGKLGILNIDATTNQACCACYKYWINQLYLFYFLLAWRDNFIAMGDGGAQSNISKEKIESTLMPLPPLYEQHRIVSSIQAYLRILNSIESNKETLTDRIAKAKSKIIDLAMQGKLVPQDPADEPAADMLRRVNPKAKIITDNPHYPQLPDNWVLTRIKDVFEINPKNKASDNIQAGFVPMASIHDGYSNKFHYDVKQWGEIKSGFTHFADGDIAVAKISPCLENRKSMILRDLPNGIGAGTTELLIFRSTILIPEFSLLFFKSDNFIKCCTGTFNGVVGQQRVGKSIVEDIHIPMPPLNIQRTIVQGVQEWFNCLDNILVSISNERDSLI